MNRRSVRRWLRYGLPLGALAAAAYARTRSRSQSRTDRVATDGRIITEHHAAAFLVGRRIEPNDVEAVLDRVERTFAGVDPQRLLGLEGASTATLFLDRSGVDPELVWYVEVPRAVVTAWDDPHRRVTDAFPVAHEALERPARSVDDPRDRALLVHAANPVRPRAFDGGSTTGERSLVVGTGDIDSIVDVDLVRMRLRPGFPERFADWFERITRRVIDGDIGLGPIESRGAEVLAAERMFTESLFLERSDDGYTCLHYMEADDMERVYDAFYDTRNPVARWSERLLGRLLENPDAVLEYPLETAARPLAHAVDPNRPRRPAECRRRGSETVTREQ